MRRTAAVSVSGVGAFAGGFAGSGTGGAAGPPNRRWKMLMVLSRALSPSIVRGMAGGHSDERPGAGGRGPAAGLDRGLDRGPVAFAPHDTGDEPDRSVGGRRTQQADGVLRGHAARRAVQ